MNHLVAEWGSSSSIDRMEWWPNSQRGRWTRSGRGAWSCKGAIFCSRERAASRALPLYRHNTRCWSQQGPTTPAAATRRLAGVLMRPSSSVFHSSSREEEDRREELPLGSYISFFLSPFVSLPPSVPPSLFFNVLNNRPWRKYPRHKFCIRTIGGGILISNIIVIIIRSMRFRSPNNLCDNLIGQLFNYSVFWLVKLKYVTLFGIIFVSSMLQLRSDKLIP